MALRLEGPLFQSQTKKYRKGNNFMLKREYLGAIEYFSTVLNEGSFRVVKGTCFEYIEVIYLT